MIPLTTPEGRRSFAFLATFGASLIFTAFSAVNIWLLREQPQYILWLAMAILGLLLVCITAFGWAMGRRMNVEGGRDGFKLNDSGGEVIRDGDVVTVEKAP